MAEQSLKERIGVDPVRDRVVAECVTLVDGQVKKKRGLSGVAIKGAYGTIKRIKKHFVSGTIDTLLDDWLDKLDPYYDKWEAGNTGGDFAEFLTSRSDEVAEDLLAVTDARAQTTKHKTAKKMYTKMRPSAKVNVIEAIPDLGKLIERHLNPVEDEADTGASDTDAA